MQVLQDLADLMKRNGWSIEKTFGELVEEGEIQIDSFLARVYQVGITGITQLQAACFSQVLGRGSDFKIAYSELALLLAEYGARQAQSEGAVSDAEQVEESAVIAE